MSELSAIDLWFAEWELIVPPDARAAFIEARASMQQAVAEPMLLTDDPEGRN